MMITNKKNKMWGCVGIKNKVIQDILHDTRP